MAYPMPMQYDEEMIERRDCEYLKSLYPMEAKRLLPYVEEECDRMEYAGSMCYDEYPDKLQLQMMARRVAVMAQIPDNLRSLVDVMLYQELYKRRCDKRKCRTYIGKI